MGMTAAFWRIVLSGCLLCLPIWTPDAFAYRPFDSTDASVAGPGEFELEFGPVGYLREGRARSFIAPAAIANFGISGDREIVLEGKLKTLQGDFSEGPRTSLVDTALSLKQVHRRGSLQDGIGPSVASECGVLLPTIRGESGAGATCAGIVSQRWPEATVHLNGAVALTREHTWNRFFGAIVEGPYEWRVRPVLEIFTEGDTGGSRTNSALVGLIWRSRENLSFDVGVRAARSNDQNIAEVRAGFTWSF
jgi:hypothetical protein